MLLKNMYYEILIAKAQRVSAPRPAPLDVYIYVDKVRRVGEKVAGRNWGGEAPFFLDCARGGRICFSSALAAKELVAKSVSFFLSTFLCVHSTAAAALSFAHEVLSGYKEIPAVLRVASHVPWTRA